MKIFGPKKATMKVEDLAREMGFPATATVTAADILAAIKAARTGKDDLARAMQEDFTVPLPDLIKKVGEMKDEYLHLERFIRSALDYMNKKDPAAHKALPPGAKITPEYTRMMQNLLMDEQDVTARSAAELLRRASQIEALEKRVDELLGINDNMRRVANQLSNELMEMAAKVAPAERARLKSLADVVKTAAVSNAKLEGVEKGIEMAKSLVTRPAPPPRPPYGGGGDGDGNNGGRNRQNKKGKGDNSQKPPGDDT